jgi:hypothetical protein
VKILEQRGIGTVELGQKGIGEVGEDVFVVIPGVESAGDGNKPDPGLDQPAGQQCALGERRAAVLFAEHLRLCFDAEGLFCLCRMHELEGRLVIRVHALQDAGGVQLTEPLIDHIQQAAAVVHSRPFDTHWQIHILDFVVILVRVAGRERVVAGTQKAGLLPASSGAGNRYRCRQFVALAKFLRHDGLHRRKLERGQGFVSAQEHVAGRFVGGLPVGHRPDDDEFVRMPRCQGKML